MIAPERAKRPVKSNKVENSVTINDRDIKSIATVFVIKLLFKFKIYPFFKSNIILKRYYSINNILNIKEKIMKQESYELFKSADIQEIVDTIASELATRNESPFWADKVVPFSTAILSVLIPLRDAGMLFDAQGKKIEILTPELFLEWSDFVSLKMLAFTVQKSNVAGELQRTKLDIELCKEYKEIDLKVLGDYLSHYTVNLEDEILDFPIAHYNLHQGVSNVIKSLL